MRKSSPHEITRDVPGADLVKALKQPRYEPTRQVGSHIRLTTHNNKTHHVTILNHSPIRIGTLASIIDNIASHFNIGREESLRQLDL